MQAGDPGGSVFLLEAKTAPNHWQSVEEVYGGGGVAARHPSRDEAHRAKSALKSLLNSGSLKVRKYPIRIRELGSRAD